MTFIRYLQTFVEALPWAKLGGQPWPYRMLAALPVSSPKVGHGPSDYASRATLMVSFIYMSSSIEYMFYNHRRQCHLDVSVHVAVI